MKQGWEIKKLADVIIDIKDGGTPSRTRPEYFGGNINWCVVKDIIPEIYETKEKLTEFGLSKCSAKVWPVNSVIISLGATIGQVGIAKVPVATKQGISGIVVNPKLIIPEFLVYYLNFKKEYIQGIATGATIKEVRPTKLATILDLPLPPLPDQQRTVAILDEALTSISKAKAYAGQNLLNTKELFESYLQSVFENPKGDWEKKKWGDLCNFVRGPFGGSLKKSIFKEEGYVVYEQKHAIHDHFNQLRYFIDEEKFNEMIRFEVKPGDIIMSCSGVTLGKVAIVPENIRRGIINQALLKLTPKKNVSVHFLKHWLRSRTFQQIIFEYSGGAAIPNVPSAKILKDILIPLPKIEEQNQVVNNIEIFYTETQRLESIYQQKLDDLEELKKSILQKAFNGELETS